MSLADLASISAPSDPVRPASAEEAARFVAEAAASATPLSIEGNGTKGAFGRPVQAPRTLSSKGLSGVTLCEPAEMVIGARSGTPLAAIEAELAGHGQMLAFEPMDLRPLLGTSGEPTVGGTVATNLSGPRRIMAGACRDALIGVTFVNGAGELIRSGGRVMKNVTGLDLVKLQAGAFGTLGFLTEAIFKVLPRPETSATLAIEGLDDADGIAVLSAGLGSPFEVSGAAHLPAGIGADRARTLLRLENNAASVAYRLTALSDALRAARPNLSTGVIEADASTSLWREVRDARFFAATGAGDPAVWRMSVAPSKAAAVVSRIAARRDARWFYDWGGGLVWLETGESGDAGAAHIRQALHGTGGHATLVRAPAPTRAAVDVFEPLAPALVRLQEDVRASLDPRRLFNPGRMYAGH